MRISVVDIEETESDEEFPEAPSPLQENPQPTLVCPFSRFSFNSAPISDTRTLTSSRPTMSFKSLDLIRALELSPGMLQRLDAMIDPTWKEWYFGLLTADKSHFNIVTTALPEPDLEGGGVGQEVEGELREVPPNPRSTRPRPGRTGIPSPSLGFLLAGMKRSGTDLLIPEADPKRFREISFSPTVPYELAIAGNQVQRRMVPAIRTNDAKISTIPSVDQLNAMGALGACVIDNFVIRHEDYGAVIFKGKVDVYGIDLDQIVKFEPNAITFFPTLNRWLQDTTNRLSSFFVPVECVRKVFLPPGDADNQQALQTFLKEFEDRCNLCLGYTYVGYELNRQTLAYRVDLGAVAKYHSLLDGIGMK